MMFRRIVATLAVLLVLFCASSSFAQSIPTSTFAGLPGSPSSGDLSFITDGSGTTAVGDPAAGGGANRDLVAYDGVDARWEIVQRLPATAPPAAVESVLAAQRVSFDATASGSSAADVQAALDELFASGGGEFTVTQTVPNTTSSEFFSPLTALFTDPVDSKFGFGMIFGDQDTWNSESYPGAGDSVNEANNHIGIYYNQEGCGGPTINQYEPAFDNCWELSYRVLASAMTWIEHNMDMRPPNNQVLLTGIDPGFNPVENDYLIFTGTGGPGTGRVISYSAGTVKWQHNYGATAAGGTVCDTLGNCATVSVTPTYTGVADKTRQFISVWQTATEQRSASWNMSDGLTPTSPPNIRMDNELSTGRNRTCINCSSASTPESASIGLGVQIKTGQVRLDNGTGVNLSALYFRNGGHDTAHTVYGGSTGDNRLITGSASGYREADGTDRYVHIVWDELFDVERMHIDDNGGTDYGRPTQSEGAPYVMGSNSPTHGPTLWAVSDASGAAVWDTGDEVCEYAGPGDGAGPGVGMSCEQVWDIGAGGVIRDCTSYTVPNANVFLAMCQ